MSDVDLLISAEQLRDRLDDPTIRIVDCRFKLTEPQAGLNDYLEGHIPGAVFADLDKDLAAPAGPGTGRHPLPEKEAFVRTLGRLGIGNDCEVVVYDDASGALAARTWWMLRWVGHDRVRLLDGGMARWQSLRYGVEAGDAEPEPSMYAPVFRDNLVLESAEIAATDDIRAKLQLVDARDPARFRGEVEPIDKEAGHIPGAANLPVAASLNEDGTWKNPDRLEAIWRECLGEGTGKPWSVMCGSGVTACHLVISGLLAGLPEPRVYIGSWSEWIEDERRPRA